MRIVGMDIHRSFAQVAILEDGEIKQQLRVDLVHHRVVEFAKTLSLDDEVVLQPLGGGDRAQAHALLAQGSDELGSIRVPDRAAEPLALGACVGEPGPHPLHDHVAFELSKGADDVEE